MKFNIGDIVINKYDGEYYLIYHIEDGYTYISLLSNNRYRTKYEPLAINSDFTIASKA